MAAVNPWQKPGTAPAAPVDPAAPAPAAPAGQRQMFTDMVAAQNARSAARGGGAPAPGAPATLTRGSSPAGPTASPLVGNAPPWLQSAGVLAYKGGPSVTMTNVDMAGLPEIDTDFSGAAKRGADAAYKGATQFFDEDFARDRSGMENKLINQGFAPGTEAFDNAMGLMLRGQNAAYQNAGFMAQGVGHAQSGDMLVRALTSRRDLLGERERMADRIYGQTMGVAGMDLERRGQDSGSQAARANAQASANASMYATDAASRGRALDAELGLRELGLRTDQMSFDQMMTLADSARGGVNMPDFGAPAPLDVGSAHQIASGNANAAENRRASDRAGLYGLGAAALGGFARGAWG